MSRRKAAPKRKIMPDPKYKSQTLAKFVNVLMHHGKKSIAEQIVYGALERVAEKQNIKLVTDEDGGDGGDGGESGAGARSAALDLFDKVLDSIRPRVEVRSRRVGGATYQVPVEVRGERSTALAMRWLIQFSRNRGEKNMVLRLAGEMSDALEGRGSAVKKREDTHRMARANQAFAHYRW